MWMGPALFYKSGFGLSIFQLTKGSDCHASEVSNAQPGGLLFLWISVSIGRTLASQGGATQRIQADLAHAFRRASLRTLWNLGVSHKCAGAEIPGTDCPPTVLGKLNTFATHFSLREPESMQVIDEQHTSLLLDRCTEPVNHEAASRNDDPLGVVAGGGPL